MVVAKWTSSSRGAVGIMVVVRCFPFGALLVFRGQVPVCTLFYVFYSGRVRFRLKYVFPCHVFGQISIWRDIAKGTYTVDERS